MTVIHTVADSLLYLLRGELAAHETYQLALAQDPDPLLVDPLTRMCREHLLAVDHLRLHVRRYGGSPDVDAHAWDSFTESMEAGTSVGDVAALGALREGERNALVAYLEVMNDPELPAECRNLIRLTLLLQTENHIAELDNLIEIAE